MFTLSTWPEALADLPRDALITADEAAVLVGGGEVDGQQLRHWAQNHPIIALDGGVDHVLAAGLTPVVVVGDMDSVAESSYQDELAAVPRLKITDQFSTDFEKALAAVKAPLILGFGLLGRRFDHSLATLHALAGPWPRGKVVVISPDDAMIFSRGEVVMTLPAMARVSVWPLTRQRFVASTGLEWPLTGMTLAAGQAIGTSNRVAKGDDPRQDGPLQDDPLQDDPRQVVITPEDGGDGMVVMVDAAHAAALIAAI